MTPAGGFMINAQRQDLPSIAEALHAAGAAHCSAAAFEPARIEQGFPWFAQDISPANLPQEVGRDPLAVSFVKGCYLGQETVARIDALGHVNKLLVGLRFATPRVPAAGAELQAGDKAVGQVTSAAYSPRYASAVALAYVRRGSHTCGTRFLSADGEAEVVTLPMA
jgi:folate-binding protein YgfZ